VYGLASFVVLVILTILPMNEHKIDTFVAGLCGIITYLLVHGLAELFSKKESASETAKLVAKTGMAGFTAFLYLEVLDASFSLDSVIGAFAVTKDVVLIAIGLGVGAIWVRSLTIFMVRQHVLGAYRYIEHGAHYTIGMLAAVLLLGIFWHVSEFVAGIIGIVIIGAAIFSSILKQRQEQAHGFPR